MPEVDELASSPLNQTRAIALAEGSEIFKADVGNLTPVFESIGKHWSYDTSCNVTLRDVEVAFDVTYNNGTVSQVTVIENAALDSVLEVTVTSNVPYAGQQPNDEAKVTWPT